MKKSYITIFVTLFFWSSAFVAIRASITDYNPFELAAFRLVVASLTLAVVAVIRKIRIPEKNDLFKIFLLGFIFFCNYICLNFGAKTVPAGEISIILRTSPFFVAVFACIMLGESITAKMIFGMIISFLGILILSGDSYSGFSFQSGSIFIFLAATTWALFMVFQKSLLQSYSPLEITSYAIWIATILILPFNSSLLSTIGQARPESTLSVVYLGLFPTVIAQFFWSRVLARIPVSKASIILNLTPVLTIIIAFLWLGEMLSLSSITGGIIVIFGVVLSSINITNKNSIVLADDDTKSN